MRTNYYERVDGDDGNDAVYIDDVYDYHPLHNTSPPKRLSSPIASPPSSPLLDPLGFANSNRSSSSPNDVF